MKNKDYLIFIGFILVIVIIFLLIYKGVSSQELSGVFYDNNLPGVFFNVTVNKSSAPCKLKVSSSGQVTATVNVNASYYGFNSSYSGNNETSKKIDINATKRGESKARLIFYYVLDKSGNKHTCYLTVIKECKCSNNSSSYNCPVSCTFRSS